MTASTFHLVYSILVGYLRRIVFAIYASELKLLTSKGEKARNNSRHKEKVSPIVFITVLLIEGLLLGFARVKG